MAKSQKKLFAATVVLVLTIALATTSTFAWFTMNTTVSIDNIESTVTSNTGGLYVSLAPTGEYKTALTWKEIAAKVFTNGGYELKDYTGTNDSSVFKLEDVAGIQAAFDGTKTTNGFLTFDIYFRGTEGFDIGLDANSAVTNAAAEAGKAVTQKMWAEAEANVFGTTAMAKGDVITAEAANALRVAFVANPYANSAFGASQEAKIWDPNTGKGFADNNALFYDKVANKYLAADDAGNANIVSRTSNMAYEAWLSIQNKLTIDATGVTVPTADYMKGTSLMTLGENGAYFEGKLTVYIYLEGTDGNCLNAVLSQKTNTALNFSIIPTRKP